MNADIEYYLSEAFQKTFKGIVMMNDAALENGKAESIVIYANEDYVRVYNLTSEVLNELNMRKAKIITNEFETFISLFSQIANVNVTEVKGMSKLANGGFDLPDFEGMRNEVKELYDFIKKGVVSYTLNGFFLGGAVMNKYAKTQLNNAKANVADAEAQQALMHTRRDELLAIGKMAKQQDKILRRLVRIARPGLKEFGKIIEHKNDWSTFSEDEKGTSASIMSLMKLIKEIVDVPIVDSKGDISREAKEIAKNKDILALGINE